MGRMLAVMLGRLHGTRTASGTEETEVLRGVTQEGVTGAGLAVVFSLPAVVHVGLAGGDVVGGVQWVVFRATR
jgi:hypothetical protein